VLEHLQLLCGGDGRDQCGNQANRCRQAGGSADTSRRGGGAGGAGHTSAGHTSGTTARCAGNAESSGGGLGVGAVGGLGGGITSQCDTGVVQSALQGVAGRVTEHTSGGEGGTCGVACSAISVHEVGARASRQHGVAISITCRTTSGGGHITGAFGSGVGAVSGLVGSITGNRDDGVVLTTFQEVTGGGGSEADGSRNRVRRTVSQTISGGRELNVGSGTRGLNGVAITFT